MQIFPSMKSNAPRKAEQNLRTLLSTFQFFLLINFPQFNFIDAFNNNKYIFIHFETTVKPALNGPFIKRNLS